MREQLTLATQADGWIEAHRKPTRHDAFLAEIDKVLTRSALCEVIEPVYLKVRPERVIATARARAGI